MWRYGYLQALDQLAVQGRADLALASDRLMGQLQRYREVAVLLADHPVLPELAQGRAQEAATALFLEVADKTAALDVMYVDANATVRAAARTDPVPTSARHRRLCAAPSKARWGGGTALGHRCRHGRLLLCRAGVRAQTARCRGSVVVAVDINAIEDAWRGGNRAVFFTDPAGHGLCDQPLGTGRLATRRNAPGLAPACGTAPAL